MVTKREEAQLEERRAKLLELDLKGYTLDQIAELSRNEGWKPRPYNSRQAVHKDVQAALKERKERRNELAEEYLERELAKLDLMERRAWEVADSVHLVVNQGEVVYVYPEEQPTRIKRGWARPALDPETVEALEREKDRLKKEPLRDEKPALDAIVVLLKIAERRAKLLGLDAPIKKQVEVTGGTAIGETIEAFIKLAFPDGNAISFRAPAAFDAAAGPEQDLEH